MPIQLALVDDLLMVAETDSDSDAVEEAAVCAAWIICNRPFPERNREIGYETLRLMLDEAGRPWPRPQEDADAIATMIVALEAERITVPKFVDWVCLRVATA